MSPYLAELFVLGDRKNLRCVLFLFSSRLTLSSFKSAIILSYLPVNYNVDYIFSIFNYGNKIERVLLELYVANSFARFKSKAFKPTPLSNDSLAFFFSSIVVKNSDDNSLKISCILSISL